MKSDTKKDVLEVARYMIANNATVDETCKKFNKSRRTIQIYINNYLKEIASEEPEFASLYNQVQLLKANSEKKSSKNIDMESVINDMIGNHLSVEVAAKKFDISESTIHKFIQNLDDNDPLKIRYKKEKEYMIKVGNYVGGKNGQRTPSQTDFEDLEMAQQRIEQQLTYKEVSEKFGVPKSTAQNACIRVNDKDIQEALAEVSFNNKRHM